jgi:lipid II:glycine glycyltransferase (peptidoglycan interpeptide bridge formation enzyme)
MTIIQSVGNPVPGWDAFVEGHGLGQFQQASVWAEAKASEGWSARWVAATRDDRIGAGAQILEKRTRFGRIGFINKGPVVAADDSEAQRALGKALVRVLTEAGFLALMVQPPDGGDFMVPGLLREGFLRETVAAIADATLLIDVSGGWEAVQAKFRRTTRREIRQGFERGVEIVDGGAGDVADFFALMKSTCQRQGARPSPGTLKDAEALFAAFASRGKARLWFAVHEGRRLAGGLAFVFGNRVSFWKKGWDQTGNPLHVNTLTTAHIIRWAAEHGHRWLDFGAMDRDTAEAMVHGTALPEDLPSRRDFFNLGFGGQGLLMPPSLIRFRNPLLGLGYRLGTLGPLRRTTRRVLARAGMSV